MTDSIAMTVRTVPLLLAATFGAAFGLAVPSLAAGPLFANRDACLEKAEAAPDFALAEARHWEMQGGDKDARACAAIAHLLIGNWALAGQALEASLAEMATEPSDIRAGLWAKAGTAWMKAGDKQKADSAFAKAIALRPQDSSLRIERAVFLAGQQKFWDAIAELDAVLKASPTETEALLLRAEAHRQLGNSGNALTDAGRAIALAPNDAQARLLRGNLFADAGRFAEARVDWAQASAGQGDAATAAARNLAALERVEAELKKK